MKRPIKTDSIVASFVFVMGTLWPISAMAQDGGAFDVGGGLLAAPPPPSDLRPGALGGGAVGPTTPTGPAGGAGPSEGRGPVFTLGVSTGLTYEDEDDEETEAFFSTRYDLGVFTETRTQQFRFNVGARSRIDEDEADLTDPFARLNYQLANRSTLLRFDLNRREADVNSTFLDPNFGSDDLIVDSGTRETQAARITLETGRASRFGTRTELGYRELNYNDTTDPDLVDEVRYDASTELRFTFDRRFETRIFADWSSTDENDTVDTENIDIRYGLSADVLIDRAWVASFDVALTEEETSTIGGTTTEDGYEITAEITRSLTNGTLAFTVSRDETDGDAIDSLTLARALALANGADLQASAGLVVFEDGDVLPSFGLRYDHEFLRGRAIALSLSQSAGQDDDDGNIFRTLFNARYSQDLTPNSAFSVTGALASVDIQDDTATDTLAVSLGAAYNHDLTRDWAFVARANIRVTYEDGDRTDRENVLSLNLERTFSFRP